MASEIKGHALKKRLSYTIRLEGRVDLPRVLTMRKVRSRILHLCKTGAIPADGLTVWRHSLKSDREDRDPKLVMVIEKADQKKYPKRPETLDDRAAKLVQSNLKTVFHFIGHRLAFVDDAHAWLMDFDNEDLLAFVRNVAEAFEEFKGTASVLTEVEGVIHEWHESALACQSGVLDEFLPFSA